MVLGIDQRVEAGIGPAQRRAVRVALQQRLAPPGRDEAREPFRHVDLAGRVAVARDRQHFQPGRLGSQHQRQLVVQLRADLAANGLHILRSISHDEAPPAGAVRQQGERRLLRRVGGEGDGARTLQHDVQRLGEVRIALRRAGERHRWDVALFHDVGGVGRTEAERDGEERVILRRALGQRVEQHRTRRARAGDVDRDDRSREARRRRAVENEQHHRVALRQRPHQRLGRRSIALRDDDHGAASLVLQRERQVPHQRRQRVVGMGQPAGEGPARPARLLEDDALQPRTRTLIGIEQQRAQPGPRPALGVEQQPADRAAGLLAGIGEPLPPLAAPLGFEIAPVRRRAGGMRRAGHRRVQGLDGTSSTQPDRRRPARRDVTRRRRRRPACAACPSRAAPSPPGAAPRLPR